MKDKIERVDETYTLYKLTRELTEIFDDLCDSDGELTPEQESRLGYLQDLLNCKVDGVAGYHDKICDMINAVNIRLSELQDYKKRLETRLKNFEGYIIGCMQAMDSKKLSGEFNTISLPKQREIIEIYDEKKIPESFYKTKMTVTCDKTLIKKAIEAGEEVLGARKTLGNQSIKFKVG